MSRSRGRKVGHARVHGSVRPWRGVGPELWSWSTRRFARADRQLMDDLSLAKQRKAADRWVIRTTRKVWKATHPLSVSVTNSRGDKLQTTAGCALVPERYIGERPMTKHSRTKGYCHGCGLEVRLVHGRIPEHTPGPPPYTHCPHCNGWLPAWYPQLKVKGRQRSEWGAYNDLYCPAFYDSVQSGAAAEQAALTNEGTPSYEDAPSWS